MTLDPVAFFAETNKRLANAVWVVDGSDLLAVANIEVEGLLLPDVQLRATAERNYPDARVMLQIERTTGPGGQRPLCRIEWRPKAGHQNKGLGPYRLRFKHITGTHVLPSR